MKDSLLYFFILMCCASFGQDAGIYQTYAILDDGSTTTYYHGGINNGGTTPYSGHTFGTVTQLMLKGGEIKSWKNSGGDVTGAKLYYRVYTSSPEPSPLPSFTELDLPWSENGVDGNGDNQKWAKSDYTTDILSGLTASETYTLEVYWKITSNVGDKLDNGSGSNFKSSFTVDSSLNINALEFDNPVLVIPNKIYFQKSGAFEIAIFNMLGSQIKRIDSNFNKNQILYLNLERGVYLINIKESQHSTTYKMPVY